MQQFTELICSISSRLAGASGERIGPEVRAGLDAIRAFIGADQCAILRVNEEQGVVVMIERVAAPGIPPVPTNFEYGKAFPLTYRVVNVEKRPFILDSLDDLPAEEAVQRGSMRAVGLEAVLAMPIVMSGAARYSLAFGCSRPHAWPGERIEQLLALGEIIASAIEREEDERRLVRNEAALVEAQRVAHMGSWVRDFVADTFDLSEEAFRILGSRPSSSAQWMQCLHEADRERVGAEMRSAIESRRTNYRFEYRIVTPAGEERAIVDHGEVRYHGEGHALLAIGAIQDVTEATRTERELRTLRARIWHADRAARAAALGGSLGHELGQPLTAILANAQAGLRLLRSGALDAAEIESILESVVRDDKRAIAIIDGLRALLRKESAAKTPMDVGLAVSEVLTLLRRELDGNGVLLFTRIETGCRALAARAQVQQVVLNLLSNALEALREVPRGERRLEVRVDQAAGAVEVVVADSGRGVAPERAAAIFEPFHTTRESGLGLGLTISRSIVEAHDGAIALRAGAHGGAEFAFKLPALARERPAPAPAPDPELAIGSGTATSPLSDAPLVCVVDDDDGVREAIGRLLRHSGYAVAAFASGEALLKSAEMSRAACALLDVRLGTLTGPELQGQLARRFPSLPVVFLTGHGDVSTGVGAMHDGAVDFLLKPVDEGPLLAAVERAVRTGSARLAVREREARLSPREREIMHQVILGRLNKQIASDLGITEATVKQHRGRVMEKMGVRSVAELVRLCGTLTAAPRRSDQGRIAVGDTTE